MTEGYCLFALAIVVLLTGLGNIVSGNKDGSCLENVKIRDGQTARTDKTPLKFATSLHLSVAIDKTCSRNEMLEYEWKAYKAISGYPDQQQLALQAATIRNELALNQNDISSGIYNIKAIVTLRDALSGGKVLDSRELVTWVQKRKQQTKVYMEGGGTVVISRGIQTAIQLKAITNLEENEAIYRWYCSLKSESLPTTIVNNAAQNAEDICLIGGTTKWLHSTQSLQIFSSALRPSDHYYIRVFASAKHHVTGNADVKVVSVTQTHPKVRILCWTNCWNPIVPSRPRVLEMECTTCINNTWSLGPMALDHCKDKRFCKITANQLYALQPGHVFNINVNGKDESGDSTTATFPALRSTPPSGGNCDFESSPSETQLKCTGFQTTTDTLKYNFYAVKPGGMQNLIQHGYDDVLYDANLSDDYATFRVEVCDETIACAESVIEKQESFERISTTTFSSAVRDYVANGDIQRLTQAMTSTAAATSYVDDQQVEQLINRMTAEFPVSMETAVQALGLINRLLQSVKQLPVNSEGSLWQYLINIRRLCDKNREDKLIRHCATMGITAAAAFLSLPSNSRSKIEGAGLVSWFGRLITSEVVPDARPIVFSAPDVYVYLKRLPPHEKKFLAPGFEVTINPAGRDTASRMAQGGAAINVDQALQNKGAVGYLNFELYTYDGSHGTFDTADHFTEEVWSLSPSTGYPNADPISSELSRKSPIAFSMSEGQPLAFDASLVVTSDCDVTKCTSVAATTYIMEIEGLETERSLAGTRLKLVVLEADKYLDKLEISLMDTDSNEEIVAFHFDGNVNHEFGVEAEQITSTFLLSIKSSLGAIYFRQGSLLHVKLQVYIMKCMIWATASQDWTALGCEAPSGVTCECQGQPTEQMAKFQEISSTFVAARIVNFLNVGENILAPTWSFWQALVDNPVVVVAHLCLCIAYTLLLVWSQRKDRLEKEKGVFIEPSDNHPWDSHVYCVTIYTGSRRHAGTTATVSMTLIGKAGKSRVHVIQEADKRRFIRGSVVSLLIATTRSLEEITAVRIWHNCAGKSPEWYIQRIAVFELSTKKCWFVPCYSWLGSVCDRIFTVTDCREMNTFRKLFRIKCENYIRDKHLWYSMFAMRPWEHQMMSRVERTTCCFMSIFVVMICSMLFHALKANQEGLVLDFSYYSFKWSHVLIGLQSAVICFPITLIVELGFRVSRGFNVRSGQDELVFVLPERARTQSTSKTDSTRPNQQLGSDVPSEGYEFLQSERHKPKISTEEVVYKPTPKPRRKSVKRRVRGSKSGVGGQTVPVKTKRSSRLMRSGDSSRRSATFDKEIPKTMDVPQRAGGGSLRASRDHTKIDAEAPNPTAGTSLMEEGDMQNTAGETPAPRTAGVALLSARATYCASWIPVAGTIATSSVMCTWVGWVYGIEMCKEWLVSVLCGVLENILVLETAKSILLAFFTVFFKTEIDIGDWFAPHLKPGPLQTHDHPNAVMLKQEQDRMFNSVYKPPTEKLIREEAEVRNRERQVTRRIKNISVHVLYLALLLVASLGQRGRDLFHFGRTIENMLQSDLHQIGARDDVYLWINSSLGDIFTGGHVRYFTDEQFLIIAAPRIRQKRVVGGQPCEHAQSIEQWKLARKLECEPAYHKSVEDKESYQPGWQKFATGKSNHESWVYTEPSMYSLCDYMGEFASYDSGGYILALPRSRNDTSLFVKHLMNSRWVDRYTRLVMFDAVAYNVAHRTYCVIRLAVEISNIGAVSTRSDVWLMRSHHIQSTADILTTVCLYGILVMVFYHLVEVASKVVERRLDFFRSLWNCFHVTTLMTSVAAVGIYLSRASYTDRALQAHFVNSESFELFDMAAQLDYLTRCLLSCSVFFTMLYTIKIMDGHPMFLLLYATLRRCQSSVCGHLAYVLFLYFAFCHVGFLLFADTMDFSSAVRTLQSVLGYSMEAFTSSELLEKHPLLGWYYLFLFFAFFNKLFINFYATILENCYRESKLLLRDKITTENIISFGRKQLRSLFTIKDQRMKNLKERDPDKYKRLMST